MRRLARLPLATISEVEMLDAQQRLASSGYYDAVFLVWTPAPKTWPRLLGRQQRRPSPQTTPPCPAR